MANKKANILVSKFLHENEREIEKEKDVTLFEF